MLFLLYDVDRLTAASIKIDNQRRIILYVLKNCHFRSKNTFTRFGLISLKKNNMFKYLIPKYLGHFIADIVTFLASDILCNTVTSRVACSNVVCLHVHVYMAIITCEINLLNFLPFLKNVIDKIFFPI